jgi:hypothetical protein
MTSDPYGWMSLALSAVTTVVFAANWWAMAMRYHKWHDDRAAVDLAVAVCFTIGALGMLVSAAGLLLDDYTMRISGLSITRGAMLLAAIVIFAINFEARRDRP